MLRVVPNSSAVTFLLIKLSSGLSIWNIVSSKLSDGKTFTVILCSKLSLPVYVVLIGYGFVSLYSAVCCYIRDY